MKPKTTKLIRDDGMYALICDDWKYRYRDKGAKRDPMLCGVYPSKKEALEVFNHPAVKECMCTHYIKKCKVTVTY